MGVGAGVGRAEGAGVGSAVGRAVGLVGLGVGRFVGVVGLNDGRSVGRALGSSVLGAAVFLCEGAAVGVGAGPADKATGLNSMAATSSWNSHAPIMATRRLLSAVAGWRAGQRAGASFTAGRPHAR